MRSRLRFEEAWSQIVDRGVMEAREVDRLPEGKDWHYEPKWDGFRCVICKDASAITLMGKSGKSLARFFPEIIEALRAVTSPRRFIIDGELVLEIDGALSFAALQMRLHPAPSRILRLAKETPARFVAFDLLWAEKDGYALMPFADRRAALEDLFTKRASPCLSMTEGTRNHTVAKRWLTQRLTETDGVVAKRLDLEYRFGERAMLKIKRERTADCVVGGFRYGDNKQELGSVLLGLFDQQGLLHHVGYTSAFSVAERKAVLKKLEKLKAPSGFTGAAPGKPSRWSSERSSAWTPVRPALVAEVRYDHVTGQRFRHGTKFLRWRPDKSPHQCRLDQLG